jgi:protein tyrosine phosphatase (PTP) superfamily phosphohydrolase (DUF442 family)
MICPALKLPRLAALRRPPARLVVLLALLPLGYEVARVTVGDNLHEVIPGRVLRCNQPTADSLARIVEAHGVRTVVNLRGFCPSPDAPWYADEVRVLNAAGVCQEDVTFSANRLPPPAELRRLIEVLDRADPPVLVHCKQGADRTGLTSVVALLLHSDATLARARRQLWPRYGHFPVARTAAMDEFFDRYERWLAGRDHTPALFRDWAANHYTPGPAQGELRLVSHDPFRPVPAKAGAWLKLVLAARNTSAEAWEMRPGNYAGVHIEFQVHWFDPVRKKSVEIGRWPAGLFRRTVPPGGEVEITLAVPPMAEPGDYSLRADLMDAAGAAVPNRQVGFYQFGADPLMVPIEVK